MKRFSLSTSIFVLSAILISLAPFAWGQGIGKITYQKTDAATARMASANAEPQGNVHRVVKGETLSRIAMKHNTTIDAILSLNNLEDKNKIYPGQLLKIPSATATLEMSAKRVAQVPANTGTITPAVGQRTITQEKATYYTVRPGDDLFSISDSKEVTVAQLKAWNPQSKFTTGERIIVGKKYSEMVVGTAQPAVNARLSGNLGNMASPSTNTPVTRSNDAALNSATAPAAVQDLNGRSFTLPNLQPQGTLLENQKYGEVNDPRIKEQRFYMYHKSIPVGSKVNVLIPDNAGYIEAEVVGRMDSRSSADVGLSPALMELVSAAPNASGVVNLSY